MRRLLDGIPGPRPVKVAVVLVLAVVALVLLLLLYDWIGSTFLDTGGTIG